MKLKYKSYIAKVTFSAVTGCFHGEVINTKECAKQRNSIVFLASNKLLLQEAFQQAVEQYILNTKEEPELIV